MNKWDSAAPRGYFTYTKPLVFRRFRRFLCGCGTLSSRVESSHCYMYSQREAQRALPTPTRSVLDHRWYAIARFRERAFCHSSPSLSGASTVGKVCTEQWLRRHSRLRARAAREVTIASVSEDALSQAAPNSMAEHHPRGWAVHMIAGGGAGLIADCIMHPVDTVKTRLQTQYQTMKYMGTLHGLRTIVAEEGVRGLYAGLGAVATGAVPTEAIYFFTYELSKSSGSKWLKAHDLHGNKFMHHAVHFASGAIADVAASVVYVPLEVVKSRLQLRGCAYNPAFSTQSFNYKNTLHALYSIQKLEGVRGLYAGYAATMARDVPQSAFQFMVYEYFREVAHSFAGTEHDTPLPLPVYMLCGLGAGIVAGFITNPLDVVKTRMQTQTKQGALDSGIKRYTTVRSALSRIYVEEGLAGLWSGASARVTWFGPVTALTFGFYEILREELSAMFS